MPVQPPDRLTRRASAWPEVERLFGALPPAVFPLGVQLRHALAGQWGETGQFAAVWARPADPAWLDLPFWLLDDAGQPPAADQAAGERHLLAAQAAYAGAAAVRASAADPEIGFTLADLGLAEALEAAAAAQLGQLFSPAHPFWETFAGPPADGAALLHLAAGAVQHAFPARFPAEPAHLFALLDRWAALDARLAEGLAVRRDAARGTLTPLLRRALAAAGLPAEPPPPAETLLGALLLTGALRQTAAEALAEIAACQSEAQALGTPTLAGALSGLAGAFEALAAVFTGAPPPAGPRLRFAPPPAGLAPAIRMAEAYLWQDLTFAGSWEVQRRGLFDEAELIGRLFPPGLILEQLSARRPDLAEAVDAWLDQAAAQGWRYYPHPAVPPDADDLGLAFRLAAHASRPDERRRQFERPLRWLAANAQPDGRLPCWFTQAVADLDPGFGATLWGDDCLTVEANLLLGLLALGEAAPPELLRRAAGRWLARWAAVGLGGNAHYTAEYALWTALQLITTLRARPDLVGEAAAGPALATLAAHLPAHSAARTPQAAALLILLTRHPAAPAAVRRSCDPAWLSLLLKRQRYDGSWAGEPLYVVPNRGEVAAWYSSRLVTTAFGWRALLAASDF